MTENFSYIFKIGTGFARKILSIKGKGILRENRDRLSLKV